MGTMLRLYDSMGQWTRFRQNRFVKLKYGFVAPDSLLGRTRAPVTQSKIRSHKPQMFYQAVDTYRAPSGTAPRYSCSAREGRHTAQRRGRRSARSTSCDRKVAELPREHPSISGKVCWGSSGQGTGTIHSNLNVLTSS